MLTDRAKQFSETTKQARAKGDPMPAPILLATIPLFAIVDGELVTALGTTDIPGMSPAYWCVDKDGHSAPVSFLEAQIFTSAQQAVQYLENERGAVTSSRR